MTNPLHSEDRTCMVSINRGSVLELDGQHSLCRSVPCSSDRMLQKSPSTSTDTIIYDLEDSVAPSEKDKTSAREKLVQFLSSGAAPDPSRVAVRLNDVTTPFFERDIHQLVRLPLLTHIPYPLTAEIR